MNVHNYIALLQIPVLNYGQYNIVNQLLQNNIRLHTRTKITADTAILII
jgi:hypothetical protein